MTSGHDPQEFPAGELALVLHTHMPYVEGFGTWPDGEEWLWEVMATVYLPLLTLLQAGAPLTLSLSPVLADQLGADGLGTRFARFLRDVRRRTHREDAAAAAARGEHLIARELTRAAGDYERALDRFTGISGDLLGALARHESWTSAATHAVLPLCATSAGARLQVASGIASARACRLDWRGGFWLPECAYAPWLEPVLSDSGVRATCVDLSDHFGVGADAHLRPLRSPFGPTLVPLDREMIELVWSRAGYPSHPSYRDHHHATAQGHHPWAADGAPYDHAVALSQARKDAGTFIRRVLERSKDGGLVVCAFDTELFGHWWYEGLAWLTAVVEQAGAQGLAISTLDDALTRHPPNAIEFASLGVSSWGTPRDLSSWDCPASAALVSAARDAELRLLGERADASPVAVRELLALQCSDWTFMVSKGWAGRYARERFDGHRAAFDGALAARGATRPPRNLAVNAVASAVLAP